MARKHEWMGKGRQALQNLMKLGRVGTMEAVRACDRLELCYDVVEAADSHLKNLKALENDGVLVDLDDSKNDLVRMRKNVFAEVKAKQDRHKEGCRARISFTGCKCTWVGSSTMVGWNRVNPSIPM